MRLQKWKSSLSLLVLAGLSVISPLSCDDPGEQECAVVEKVMQQRLATCDCGDGGEDAGGDEGDGPAGDGGWGPGDGGGNPHPPGITTGGTYHEPSQATGCNVHGASRPDGAICPRLAELERKLQDCDCPPDPEDPPPEDPETCDLDEPVTLHLSADDSNSMSSPVQAREAVLSGWNSLSLVPIRGWEFFNYYSFDYPPASSGLVNVALDVSAKGEGRYVLQIGVSSEAIDQENRRPMNLTWVLDTSGSMAGHSIDLLRSSLRTALSQLRRGDIVSMATWDTANEVVLDGLVISGPDDPRVVEAIEGITAGGGTDLHGGLVAGYRLANENRSPDRTNRIILISDGGANVGVTDEEIIASHAGGQNEDGIYMVGVGVGSASSYYDLLMDTVTDMGKGASVFLPHEEEVAKVFGKNFINTLEVAARDIRVQLDLPPGFSLVTFSGEEWSEDPAQVEPQNIAPNDTMVFHQEIETCAPELVGPDTKFDVRVRYKHPITFEEHEVVASRAFGELMTATSPQLLKGSAIFAYAQSLSAIKGIVGENAEPVSVADALAAVNAALLANPRDPELLEIRSILSEL